MTIKSRTKTKFTILMAVIISLTLSTVLFSAQTTFATPQNDTQNQTLDHFLGTPPPSKLYNAIELGTKLGISHQVLTDLMVRGNVTAKLATEQSNSTNAEIPLVLSYIDIQKGTLIVGVHEKGKLTTVEYEQKLRKLVSDIPMEVVRGEFVRDACTDQTINPCRPIWGGVQVASPTISAGTLGVRVITDTGITGFIISGHVAGYFGTTGDSIYQPDNTPTSNLAGTVDRNPKLEGTTRSADAAFIKPSTGVTVENKIFSGPNTAYTVANKLGTINTPPGTNIKMRTINSASEISGTVVSTGLTISDIHGTLTDQVRASWTGYTTANGDSGAPIYSTPISNQVNFYGIHVGKFCVGGITPGSCGGVTYPMYSSWDAGLFKGIKTHLALSG